MSVPWGIVAFNTADGRARHVTAEIIREVLALAGEASSLAVRDVVEWAR